MRFFILFGWVAWGACLANAGGERGDETQCSAVSPIFAIANPEKVEGKTLSVQGAFVLVAGDFYMLYTDDFSLQNNISVNAISINIPTRNKELKMVDKKVVSICGRFSVVDSGGPQPTLLMRDIQEIRRGIGVWKGDEWQIEE